jgi:aspartate/methionine/tyrosine aminotransferase
MAHVLSTHSVDLLEMRRAFVWRRDSIVTALKEAGFTPLPVEGTYYVFAGYRERYGEVSSASACKRLFEENLIATVPASTFYHDGFDPQLLRFCYALPESDIHHSVALLKQHS